MMSSMSALFRGSSTAAFDGLYRRTSRRSTATRYAVLGNHADAEDVTQTTFLNAYRALEQGVKPRKAENWLMTIAHNQVRQHFRTVQGKPLEVELDETLSGTEHERERAERRRRPARAAAPPPAQRSAIVMREFEGRPTPRWHGSWGHAERARGAALPRPRRSLAELEECAHLRRGRAALSRQLDGRLAALARLAGCEHLRECPTCARFEHVQRDQRKLLKGLAVIPVPASIFLFRGETAAAATGVGAARRRPPAPRPEPASRPPSPPA